jgi:hypothetical protein
LTAARTIRTARNILARSPVVITSELTSKAQQVRDGDARSGRSASGIRPRIAKPVAVFKQGDVPVTDLPLAGLPAPSLIRAARIATIGAADATKLGKVSAASLRKVRAAIGRELGFRDRDQCPPGGRAESASVRPRSRS